MHRPPPLRGRSPFDGRKVLLIDQKQVTRDTRANVLRSHGVEVDAADSLQRARVLWKPHRYDLVLLDVRRQFPGEALQFYEQIRDASPRQRFAFLVGSASLCIVPLAPRSRIRGQLARTVGRDGDALLGCCLKLLSGNLRLGEILGAACGKSFYGSSSLHNSPGQADSPR